jgi:signal transduction histidine kinase
MWFCVVFFCGFVMLGVSAYLGLRASCVRVIDNEQNSRADGVESFLGEHIRRLPLARLQQEISLHAALKPSYLEVQDQSGGVLYCGAALSTICNKVEEKGSLHFTTDQQLRVFSTMRTIKGTSYRIRVGSDLGFQKDVLNLFFFWLLVIAPVALASSALGGYWLSGRALLPVRGIIREVHAIGEQSLGKRLRVPETGDEIQLLSETLNGMLGRIERAFRQVTDITTNASHELRTPVSVIRTAAEIALLNARPTVASHRNSLLQICVEAEKSTRLLDSMLMLARAESGVQLLHFATLSLAESARQAVKSCHDLAEIKRISLTCEHDGSDVTISADPAHLNRLWMLLIDNAIKYTPCGGRVIVCVRLNDRSEAVCEISDNGIGIEPADLPQIFERFYRADNAKQSTEPGSGLGLAIARKIVESHQGAIDVSSVPGAGSSFRVTFNRKSEPVLSKIAHEGSVEMVATSGR